LPKKGEKIRQCREKGTAIWCQGQSPLEASFNRSTASHRSSCLKRIWFKVQEFKSKTGTRLAFEAVQPLRSRPLRTRENDALRPENTTLWQKFAALLRHSVGQTRGRTSRTARLPRYSSSREIRDDVAHSRRKIQSGILPLTLGCARRSADERESSLGSTIEISSSGTEENFVSTVLTRVWLLGQWPVHAGSQRPEMSP
jgi:hypothetical protein